MLAHKPSVSLYPARSRMPSCLHASTASLPCHLHSGTTEQPWAAIRPSRPAGNGVAWAADAGTAAVRELDWLQPQQLQHFQPVDFVLATDCVYSEDLIPHLLRAVLHLAGDKTTGGSRGMSGAGCPSLAAFLGLGFNTLRPAHRVFGCAVVVCNELRSHSVHSAFQDAFQPHFTFKKVSAGAPSPGRLINMANTGIQAPLCG